MFTHRKGIIRMTGQFAVDELSCCQKRNESVRRLCAIEGEVPIGQMSQGNLSITQSPNHPITQSLGHFAGTDAGGTNQHGFLGAVHHGVHAAQIGFPAPFCDVVSVTDSVPECGTFAADFARACHG
jgi:hypothetical protein